MSIIYEKESKIFLLKAKNAAYALKITDDGRILHLHFGGLIGEADHRNGLDSLIVRAGASSFSPTPQNPPYDGFSPDIALQEYPTEGCGDYRPAALRIKAPYGGCCTDIRYVSHRISARKYTIDGQPATYAGNDEADTLMIVAVDSLTGAEVTLLYGVFRKLPVITRAVRVKNTGKEPFDIEQIYSAAVDFSRCDLDMVNLWGMWAAERSIERRPLAHGSQGIGSRRGSSSHFQNPFVALCEHSTTEQTGEAYGFSLIYSSNHKTEVEVDGYGQTRLLMGIHPDGFGWRLEPGEVFDSPEVAMVYSEEGLGGMSRAFHKLYRYHLCRGEWKEKLRPILINNWEATYFDFNEEKLYDIAKAAKELGIEMLVMDDGWFGRRNNDRSSLGDWFVNEEKLKGGLPALVEKINGLGMKFGIWFEPEMISPDSELYRAHPDWCLHVRGRERTLARQQLVLDMSRADVRDYLFDRISEILSFCNIEYVKWDFNRNLTEVASDFLPPERQKETAHRYVLGLYELLERLLAAFPHLLLEGCSGGGGRFDPAMLYYSPQIWTSDDTDAMERIKIQYGTSMVYPASAMSAHVSASPNHQTGRRTSLETRGRVAMAGAFGYELDLTRVSEEDRALMRRQVAQYHRYAPIVQNGDLYRLRSPFEGDFGAWMYVTPDRGEALVSFAVLRAKIRTTLFLRLCGLDPDKIYVDQENGERWSGALLMKGGLNLCGWYADGSSRMLHLVAE